MIQSVIIWLPNFSNLISSKKTTFYLNLNFLCFLSIMCPLRQSGRLLILAPSVSISFTREIPLQLSKTQLGSHFLFKHLPRFPGSQSLFPQSLFILQLQLNFDIIHSTFFFFCLTSTMSQPFFYGRVSNFCKGPYCKQFRLRGT